MNERQGQMSGWLGRIFGMRGLWRMAMVAVMAVTFGMAGFVASAEAVVALSPEGWSISAGTVEGTKDTLNHANGTGSNRVIIIGITAETNAAQTISNVTYGGAPVTHIASAQEAPGATGYNNWAWLGYCDEACISAASGTTITYGTTSTTNLSDTIHAATFTGVDQTTPINNFNQANLANSPVSTSVTNVAGNMAVYVVNYNGVGANSITAPTNFTEGSEGDTAGAGHRGETGYSAATGTLTINPATSVASNRSTIAAVSLNQILCTDTVPSSITANATTTAIADFNGASLFTLADISSPEYQVTESTPAPGVQILDSWTNSHSSIPNNTAATNLSVGTVNLSAGSKRLFLGAVCAEDGTANTGTMSLALGGTTLNPIGTTFTTSAREWCYLGYLKESEIPAGTALTATYSGFANNLTGLHVKWGSYSGVDQTTPINASNATYAGGTSVTFGAVIAYLNKGMTVFAAANGSNTVVPVITNDGGQFTIIQNEQSSGHGSVLAQTAQHSVAGSYPANTTITWTGGSARSALVVASLTPDVAPVETVKLAWNADPQEATAAGLVNGNSYTIYARGTDTSDACNAGYLYAGGGASPGTGKSFTWSSCSDSDIATLTTTAPTSGSTVGGMVTIRTQVGVETTPAAMTGMSVTIAGSVSCNVAGAAMSWNAGSSRWEYSWNTSACGTVTTDPGVTINVSGVDPDCGTAVNAAQINNVTIDNTCINNETLALGSIPASINGDTPISATGSAGTSNIRVGTVPAPANTSPWTYVPPVNATGSVTFYATATGDCGTFSATPVTVAYDTRTGTVAGTATATGADGSIDVTAPYSADSNINNTLLIEWVLAGGNFATPLGSQPLTHAATPYSYSIPGLTNGTAYDVRVTYLDSNGIISGTAIQTFTNVIPKNLLMHNSLTTGSSKWPIAQSGKTNDGWGITGGKYGKFTCDTCHVKNATPNIKRIKTTITAPDPVPSNFPGSAATVLFTTTDEVANPAESGFGDDNPPTGRTLSDKVCEVCHSVTKYHRYDTSAQAADGGNLTHYNNQDCVSCHQHKQGFKASCDSCHGNPPIDLATLVNTPAATTSDQFGAHAGHVLDDPGPQYSCGVCHGIPFGSGANHTTQLADIKVTIDFNAFGSTGASVAGTYKGQIGVVYDGDNDGAPDDSLTCAATYCHGGTIGGTTPTWTGTAACGTCHGATAGTPPASPASSLSHQTHAGTGGGVDAQNSITLTGTVMACSACHGANGAGPASHLDGKTQFDVTALASDYRNPAITVKYKTAQSGDSGALAKVNPYSTCTNSACHWNTVTPAWNSGPATCGTCHPASPTSGKHADHTTASATYVTCNNCHGTGATTGTHAGHINGSVNFYATVNATDNNLDATDFVGEATRGDTRDDYCAAVCHKDGDWGDGSVASTATVPANKGLIDWTVDCSNVPVVDACTDCHSGTYSGKAGPTVIKNWATTPTGSHLKAATTDTLPGNACADVTTWKTQCQKCHTKHSGTVQIPLPPTSWDNPGTAAVETTNMRTQLGISYAGADHGAIKLGGTSTSGSTEADLCWNCHGTLETINEWAYNQDTNGATFPTTIIPDRNAASSGSHNYGYIYTTSARTTKASAWVNASGVGNWHQDGYSTLARLQRQITSVHSGNFTPANQVSSVGTAVNATTGVITATAQETPANIRCSYCHDVHDLNLAASDTNTGRPYLRGSWMGNPYAPDLPPVSTDVYPASNAGANAYMFTSTTAYAGKPRLFSTSTQKGGYFLDANSGRPTTNASYDTLAKTAGVCTLCHGTDVDNMDFYPNSTAATKMWRGDQVNGHANSTLGGSGASHANARKLFDARRGTAANPGVLPVYMGSQDVMWLRVTSLNPNFNYGKQAYEPNATFTAGTVLGAVPAGAVPPQNTAPHRTWNPSQPANSGHTGLAGHPARIIGWYGGTAKGNVTDNNQSTLPSEFFNWYSSTGIGTDGSGSGRAHSFTCSKCHTPHASGLPALLITNCLDTKVSTWGTTAYGPNATGTFGLRAAVTCHRNEGTTTGWHKLAVNQ